MSAVAKLDRLHIVQGQTAVALRPLVPSDAVQIGAMLERCSPETRRLRFLTSMPRVTARVVHLLSDPGPGAGGVVAAIGDRIVGVAHHGPIVEGDAEVAVLVEDVWQGRGIGKLLMGRLLGVLAAAGARSVSGSMLRENQAAIGLLETTTTNVRQSFDGPSLDFRASFAAERYGHPAYGMGAPRIMRDGLWRSPAQASAAG